MKFILLTPFAISAAALAIDPNIGSDEKNKPNQPPKVEGGEGTSIEPMGMGTRRPRRWRVDSDGNIIIDKRPRGMDKHTSSDDCSIFDKDDNKPNVLERSDISAST